MVATQQAHWCAQLQVGDKVILRRIMSEALPSMGIVVRLTPQQVLVDDEGTEHRFWRKNGEEVSSDRWHRKLLSPYTDEDAAAIRQDALRRKLLAWAHSLDRKKVSHLTTEQYRTLFACLKEYSLL